MKATLAILTLLVCTLLACCTSHVLLDYSPPPIVVSASPVRASVTVGDFTDDRRTQLDFWWIRSNTWLGSVGDTKGGIPLSELASNEPVSALVSRFFTAGLRPRGLASDSSKGRILLSGSIIELVCRGDRLPAKRGEFWSGEQRSARAAIQVVLSEADGGRRLFDQIYRASNSEYSPPAWQKDAVERLRALMEKTLRQVVDQALDDPALLNALRLEAPGSTP